MLGDSTRRLRIFVAYESSMDRATRLIHVRVKGCFMDDYIFTGLASGPRARDIRDQWSRAWDHCKPGSYTIFKPW